MPEEQLVVQFTDKGKAAVAAEYGFASWTEYWAWRRSNPEEYRRVHEAKLAELRAEIAAEA